MKVGDSLPRLVCHGPPVRPEWSDVDLENWERVTTFAHIIQTLSDDGAVEMGTMHPDTARAVHDLAAQIETSGLSLQFGVEAVHWADPSVKEGGA